MSESDPDLKAHRSDVAFYASQNELLKALELLAEWITAWSNSDWDPKPDNALHVRTGLFLQEHGYVVGDLIDGT